MITFNQDATCVARILPPNGFVIYNCDPLKKRFERLNLTLFPNGLSIIEPLFKTNIFALVGTGSSTLCMWDYL